MAAGAFGISLTVSSAGATTKPAVPSAERIVNAEISNATNPVNVGATGAVLSGYVYDPNGAVLPGASVVISSQGGLSLFTTTDGEGRYLFEGLPPADYSIRVEANGFAPAVVTNVSVRADSNNVINQTLSIASVQAAVEIDSGEGETRFVVNGGAALPQPTEPLVLAAQSDDLDTLKQLLAAKPNVNIRDKHSDSTALEHAVLNANREMIQLLLWAGADVNAKDGSGRTPLMMLGEKITSDAVWDLINAGAKVNLHDEDGDTALIEAAGSNNLDVLRALLDAGAKVNTKNNDGQTALMHAAGEGLVNNVRGLILAGADVNVRDNKGKTAWKLASEGEHSPVLRLLRSYGVDEGTEHPNEPKTNP